MQPSQQPFSSKDIIDKFLTKQSSTKEEQISAEEEFGRSLDQYKKRYREVRHLGEGGMGSVILVVRRADQKQFAAKKQIKTNPAEYRIAKAELKILQKVHHPNIVKFEESFCSENNNELIIIIEYCNCKFASIVSLTRVCRRRPARSNWALQKTGTPRARGLHSLVHVLNHAGTPTLARTTHPALRPETRECLCERAWRTEAG